jgi:putative component of toxin-antitoxin plasmid stabilization module
MAGAKSTGSPELPAPSEPLNTVHESGLQRTVVFAKLKDGSEPARLFYDSLMDDDKERFDGLFIQMCEHGALKNDQKFHPSVGEIKCVQSNGVVKEFVVSEFKVHRGPGYRIFAVLEKDTYVLTHGCKKPSKNQFATEKNRAQRFYCEDRDRRLLTLHRKGS